jgi:hypothetical protein
LPISETQATAEVAEEMKNDVEMLMSNVCLKEVNACLLRPTVKSNVMCDTKKIEYLD